jgi:hypothetical protein
MSKITLQGDVSGTGTLTIAAPNTNTNRTLNLPDASGTALVADTPTASTTNTVTNKIPVVIGGTTYYLLASTSGA